MDQMSNVSSNKPRAVQVLHERRGGLVHAACRLEMDLGEVFVAVQVAGVNLLPAPIHNWTKRTPRSSKGLATRQCRPNSLVSFSFRPLFRLGFARQIHRLNRAQPQHGRKLLGGDLHGRLRVPASRFQVGLIQIREHSLGLPFILRSRTETNH